MFVYNGNSKLTAQIQLYSGRIVRSNKTENTNPSHVAGREMILFIPVVERIILTGEERLSLLLHSGK
jgi:hypothetical protein